MLVASGCQHSPVPAVQNPSGTGLHIDPSPSPFSVVTSGSVRAMIPDDWQPVQTAGASEGFVASPEPEAFARGDGSVVGMSATWVNATRIGIPSDFYYLAAAGPLLGNLTSSRDCRTAERRVLVDHRPSWMTGAIASPGDYLARGDGTCEARNGMPMRWAYFVAAPGFGAARQVGIPASGLYLVVAVLRDTRRAPQLLHMLLGQTRFGEARIRDIITAARAA